MWCVSPSITPVTTHAPFSSPDSKPLTPAKAETPFLNAHNEAGGNHHMQIPGPIATFGTSRNHASANNWTFTESNPRIAENKGFSSDRQPDLTRQMPEITHLSLEFSQVSGFRTQAPSPLPKLKTSRSPNEPRSAQVLMSHAAIPPHPCPKLRLDLTFPPHFDKLTQTPPACRPVAPAGPPRLSRTSGPLTRFNGNPRAEENRQTNQC
jgi:hypothetical protein